MSTKDKLGNFQPSQTAKVATIQNLSKLWAKKYVQKHSITEKTWQSNSPGLRAITAQRLLDSLRTVMIQSWIKTEDLLCQEIKRQGINYRLIDPWQITKDTYLIYEKVLLAYADQVTPERLCLFLSSELGRLRHNYTAIDPRVIAFVSLQFHYSGQFLLKSLSPQEQATVSVYFQVIDDCLYMPLQRLYKAAANYEHQSLALVLLRQILPDQALISQQIATRIIDLHPNYHCYSGRLANPSVKSASIRDVELFQVYLWLCVLEKSIAPIQEELFPLCVMLYPSLNVGWELVRHMIHLLGLEFSKRLSRQQIQIILPYLQVLWEMFSPEVFPERLPIEALENSA
ncbi:MAG: hypothetical protein RID09_29950 [Coleofasciculus sp. G1-WW12-02]|uniref:hypothetical protein n=1 Tax=unclassified Coleofasciculus TaxID=2692782 RepID=UPI003304E636